VSDWVAEEMHEKYRADETYVYPNATLIPDEKIDKNNKNIKFLFAGRIEEEKGLDLAIEALKRFAQKFPDKEFTFDIYGSGNEAYLKRCKTLAEPIASKVNFRGKVESKEQIYSDASILLMPTRMREPFGMVIIEAMAHRCAVVATNAYGPSEIIEHGKNGLLFDMNRPIDFLTQIERLYFEQKLLKRLQENAYEHVSKNYSIFKVKTKVEKLLRQIAGVA